MCNEKYLFSSDDHSRVVLNKANNDPNSDYINANYITVRKIWKYYLLFSANLSRFNDLGLSLRARERQNTLTLGIFLH